jgi:hypothetical protein
MTDLGWHRFDDLHDVSEDHRARIFAALDERAEARFEGGI